MNCKLFLLLVILFSVQIVFAQKKPTNVKIIHTDSSKIVYGRASFYSKSLEGTRTAMGGRYHHEKMTAASNFFKLGTWVRVTRIATGKSVIVYINDRTHPSMAKRGRVVDLSRAAAIALKIISAGVVKVKVESVDEGTVE
ncbi:hypothetical protein A9P82_00900 [Arachidicoccus ginsenosidimutans]|uniref:septal ring lytic transglycosylase RlpA family protein n=1 Tax=Arachidicoccus sp. BS20 TaxID=1850526 RepID=UPI0007F0F823|nr:septal ring lytic transglycosylase RlpA family protein [Arachidicoccus sp. BS20]ANI88001.1 hypothetical protein A9P82_00900 [Arachidicoccus sp. BS20]